MNWVRSAAPFMGTSARSIPSTCEAMHTSPTIKASRRSLNFKKFLAIAGLLSAILSAHSLALQLGRWHACAERRQP